MAEPTTAKALNSRVLLGLLLQNGLLLVPITNTTSVCVISDSKNQPLGRVDGGYPSLVDDGNTIALSLRLLR
jgi:hypothetical protein